MTGNQRPTHEAPDTPHLILLDGSVGDKTHIVVDVKVEEGARFPSGFVNDEVVERVMLSSARAAPAIPTHERVV